MDKNTLNGLSPEARKRILEGLKQHGIVNELEDLVTTLGGEQFKVVDVKVRHGGEARGNAKQLALYKACRTNGAGTAGPDITGITADGCVVEGDLIPAAPKLTADEIRSIMANFGVPQQQPRQPRDWSLAPRFDVVMGGVPCATHAKAGDFAARRAGKRNIALLTSHIQSIDGDELDQLLAPYIAHGLLRTIYAARATEYRGPSGKLIAITIGRNHYRNRDAVLGGSPALYAQWIGRIQRVLPTGDQIRESSAGAGKSVVIPFPENGAGQ